ncbi:DUF2703 domain-containing protein [Desulfosporosinus sp.]|uniref:DUF2703 domain-containing protein n=1 Tax=Desulfosporosinus sp. TaxID=157907 RepID=UPI00262C8A2C|nr:DUF2703 domain-containing protein [Desulfosporosinus sp.]
MKTLTIEWRHLDVGGETCNRCYDTGENLNQEVKRLNRTLQPQGIGLSVTDHCATMLPPHTRTTAMGPLCRTERLLVSKLAVWLICGPRNQIQPLWNT